MQRIEIAVTNPTGLHTRPGTEFVRLAKTFSSNVFVQKGEKNASAKSLIKLLQIGISQGDLIVLSCEGSDELAAIEQLKNYIMNLKN